MDTEEVFQKKKRLNKNRPQEVSSKRPHVEVEPSTIIKKVEEPIDPRFDCAFGQYDEKIFNSSYGFLEKIKKREKFQLVKQLKKEKNPEEQKKIRYLLERTANQEKEKKRKEIRDKKIEEQKKKFTEAVFAGKKPSYPNKKEQVAEDVIGNFANLTSEGKLDKYIKKKIKKNKKHEPNFSV